MPVEISLHWCRIVRILISSSLVIDSLIFSFSSLFTVSFCLLCFGFNKLMNLPHGYYKYRYQLWGCIAMPRFRLGYPSTAVRSWAEWQNICIGSGICIQLWNYIVYLSFFFSKMAFQERKRFKFKFLLLAFSSVSVVNPMKTFLHMSYRNPHRNLIALLGWDLWCI